ncbi:MAG: glycosyltransferase family 2 protein, partial [Caldiserica bacterium]
MPAYNAEKTIELTYNSIPKDSYDEIIVGDDSSSDRTVEIAESLGLDVLKTPHNMGYGSNQKMLYREAIRREADIIVMVHPDYQYDPRLVPYLVGLLEEDFADVMLGTRIRSRKEAIEGGMPLYKYLGNRFLTFIENVITGLNLTEWHTGMRAYKREVLEGINFEKNSDGFLFDTQVLFQVVAKGYRIGEVPCPTKYFPEASSTDLKESIKYGIGTIFVCFQYI